MNANQPDSRQIQQYLNGELDAKAMHRLERQAQDDPFLMDALEGYQTIGRDQQTNLNELKNHFSSKKGDNRNIILWRMLPIAASLLIAITIGWLWLSPKTAENYSAAKITSPIQDSSLSKQASVEKPESIARAMPVAPGAYPKHNSGIAGPIIPAAQQRNRSHLNDVLTYTHNKKDTSALKGNNGKLYEHSYATQVPDLNILPHQHDNPTIVVHGKWIKGIVTDTTGHILAGVKIVIEGTKQTAYTDSTGTFEITTLTPDVKLDIVYTGYDSKKVMITGGSGLKIILNESTNVLAQVSVPGYVDDTTKTAHPLSSWKAFKEYIRKNAFIPSGTTGSVKLAFVIDTWGKVNGIRVLRGKNDALNQKAIDLVMNAPEWIGAKVGKEMTLKIKFRRMKNV